MRAVIATAFGADSRLVLADPPRAELSSGRLLVRLTAAGVTPLDHTILTGHFPLVKAPLVLSNEGAGVVEAGGDVQIPNGPRVMFTGPYGVFENGTLSEWVCVKREHLCVIPDNVDDTSAAGLPIAYLSAQIALRNAGFQAGKTVLAPAIGGSVGNAVTQLARAQGAKHAISTSTGHAHQTDRGENLSPRGGDRRTPVSDRRPSRCGWH
jgi:NADPH:quinone reductase